MPNFNQSLQVNDLNCYYLPFSESNVSENNTTKIFKAADVVIITGACSGKDIKVYTPSGTQIKSIVANEDIGKINLPTN